jgi:hypothetical protein
MYIHIYIHIYIYTVRQIDRQTDRYIDIGLKRLRAGGKDPSLPPEEPVVVVKISLHVPFTMEEEAILFVGDTSDSLPAFTCAYVRLAS